MGSTGVDSSSQTSIQDELLDTGNRLLENPSSTRELLALLEKAESVLAKVWQQPPMTTRGSLLPVMKALITEEIMHHADVNVQVLVASCIDELSRISAPDAPYPDDNMRVFFRLFMVAFQHLPSKSGANTSRALKIVETMAKVRSGLMLLDIDEEGLVFEMFRLFLNNIRPCHPRDIFKYMEMTMSLVIQESDEISIELLNPLLDSVKKGNESSSPISFNLAKKVFQNCATNVQTFLKDAIKEKKLDPEDYAEIITSLVSDASIAETVVPNDVMQTADDGALQLDVSEAKHECHAGPSGEDGAKLVSETSLETLNGSQQPVKSGTDPGASRRKRGRKPSSVMRPEEGYQHPLSAGGKNSAEVSSDRKIKRKKDVASSSSSQVGEKSMLADASEKDESPKVVSQVKRGRPRKKNIVSEQNDQEKLKREETEPAKTKSSEKEKEKKARRPRVDYGEEMVNQRIQVWWPMDETYYTGTITEYDPAIKKHTVLYDDDEIEVLNLKKEEWKLFSDEQLDQTQEAKQPFPAKETTETEEKNIKRKSVASKKHIVLSSKRSKGESTSSVAGVNSETDERNDETHGRSVSQKDAGGSRASKSDSAH